MLKLSSQSINDAKVWQEAGIALPKYSREKMASETGENPIWIHFGAGNIFRGFLAMLQQTLLDSGAADRGIVAVEAYDFEIIDRIYKPYDNLSLLVIMNPDGSLDKKVIGSVSEGLVGDRSRENDWNRLKEMFKKPSLQMASFTVTEKGYALKRLSGDYDDDVQKDMSNGPDHPVHVMSKVAALAYARYKNGGLPIAFVSMDNCSRNGERLFHSVREIAGKWVENGLAEPDFFDYINGAKVSFPWSMIDKITPRPSETVKKALSSAGFESNEIICTSKNTYIAPFVNAERPQYLVVEDAFPNGRPPLERAGVLFTDRDTVSKTEKMKVCTCLNPLHTALAVFGCLLGYDLIADEMKDSCLRKLVEKIGYEEGLPVVINPGIIDPESFIREVIEQRLPNPYIPDTPQRIATDTSQKIGIRFGETIRAYQNRADLDPAKLTYIPLAIAGWCRYLTGVDDNGKEMTLSPDPMLDMLKPYLSGIKLGNAASAAGRLKPVISNADLFGLDLYEAGVGQKIESFFAEMISGKNAVRSTLQKYLGQ
jgi:fructuronate reductase